eukprot:Skav234594  [mRNA]  locus=scaffold540:16480:37514:- [translate_table: standard]
MERPCEGWAFAPDKMVHSAALRVRIEPGIPKLLVKINPIDAETFHAKNLGEVTLRKGVTSRSQVAVLHMSRQTAKGEVLMSVKLADLLDLEDGEGVEVAAAASAFPPSSGRRSVAEPGGIKGDLPSHRFPQPSPVWSSDVPNKHLRLQTYWQWAARHKNGYVAMAVLSRPKVSLDPSEWFRNSGLASLKELRPQTQGERAARFRAPGVPHPPPGGGSSGPSMPSKFVFGLPAHLDEVCKTEITATRTGESASSRAGASTPSSPLESPSEGESGGSSGSNLSGANTSVSSKEMISDFTGKATNSSHPSTSKASAVDEVFVFGCSF